MSPDLALCVEVFHDLSPCICFAGELQNLRELGYCNMLSQVLFTDERPCEGPGKLQLGFSLQPLLVLLRELLWDEGHGEITSQTLLLKGETQPVLPQ